jgi:hypothetical protein
LLLVHVVHRSVIGAWFVSCRQLDSVVYVPAVQVTSSSERQTGDCPGDCGVRVGGWGNRAIEYVGEDLAPPWRPCCTSDKHEVVDLVAGEDFYVWQ